MRSGGGDSVGAAYRWLLDAGAFGAHADAILGKGRGGLDLSILARIFGHFDLTSAHRGARERPRDR